MIMFNILKIFYFGVWQNSSGLVGYFLTVVCCIMLRYVSHCQVDLCRAPKASAEEEIIRTDKWLLRHQVLLAARRLFVFLVLIFRLVPAGRWRRLVLVMRSSLPGNPTSVLVMTLHLNRSM